MTAATLTSAQKERYQQRVDFWMRKRRRTSRTFRKYAAIYAACRDDILLFCAQFGFQPTWQQKQLLLAIEGEARMAFADRKKRVAVKSGQGPGKTACLTMATLWRAFRAFESMTVVTAPTMRQVKTVFFTECRRWIKKAAKWIRDLITMTATRMVIGGCKDWFITGISASKPEALAGLHEKRMTFVFEEASGVMRALWETTAGTMSHQDSLWIAIGNPTDRTSAFFDCFNKDRDLWHTFTWNAEDTARDYHHISMENILRLKAEHGENSDFYRVRVKGEFPTMDPDVVMSSEDLEKCSEHGYDRANPDDWSRYYELVGECHPLTGKPVLQFGIDLARFGSDESVIYVRQGNAIICQEYFSKVEPAAVVLRAFQLQEHYGWKNEDCTYVFDAGGMGQGVAFLFPDAGKQYIEFQNGAIATESTTYENAITEAYFELGRLVANHGIYIPKGDRRLITQCSTRRYGWKTKQGRQAAGRLALEKKEDYKARMARELAGTDIASSPDRGDSLAMAFYDCTAVCQSVVG